MKKNNEKYKLKITFTNSNFHNKTSQEGGMCRWKIGNK